MMKPLDSAAQQWRFGELLAIAGVIGPLLWFRVIVTLLITPLITTHEPPSRL